MHSCSWDIVKAPKGQRFDVVVQETGVEWTYWQKSFWIVCHSPFSICVFSEMWSSCSSTHHVDTFLLISGQFNSIQRLYLSPRSNSLKIGIVVFLLQQIYFVRLLQLIHRFWELWIRCTSLGPKVNISRPHNPDAQVRLQEIWITTITVRLTCFHVF